MKIAALTVKKINNLIIQPKIFGNKPKFCTINYMEDVDFFISKKK